MSESTAPDTQPQLSLASVEPDAAVVYARKTAALLQQAGETSLLASENMSDEVERPTTPELLGSVVLMGAAQLAATTAVAEQLGAVLAELRQRPEPVESVLESGPDEVTPGWLVGPTDLARLRARLTSVAHRFTTHDAQRRQRLVEDLHDVLDTWADGQ